MPSKPARLCGRGGCRGVVRGEVCSHCGPRKRSWAEKNRGSAASRGYGSDWTRLAERYKASHPLCEACERCDRVTVVEQVNHIVPFVGRGDPLRLLWENLESLCVGCHRRRDKHQREARRRYEAVTQSKTIIEAVQEVRAWITQFDQ